MTTHLFHSRLAWSGAGRAEFNYPAYSRALTVRFEGRPDLQMSAAQAFLGDPTLHNPEDLLLASASACHALTFLAIASRARLEVLAYEDEGTAVMAPVDGKPKITEITLRPKVTFAANVPLERTEAMHAKAHEHCFIARSVNFPIHIEHTHTLSSSPSRVE
jgi:organic hydroperoxide reductase OsmC/OhrA